MFSRTTTKSQQPQQPAAARRPEAPAFTPSVQIQNGAAHRPLAKSASVLAADLVFEGAISGDGELMIDGAVKGDVHVSRLIIGEHAQVEGIIRGTYIEVRGHVHGDIEGKAVRLLETAHVEGDITHEQLSIEVGAFFQGRCAQLRPPPAQTAPQPVQRVAASVVEAPAANVMELDQAVQG